MWKNLKDDIADVFMSLLVPEYSGCRVIDSGNLRAIGIKENRPKQTYEERLAKKRAWNAGWRLRHREYDLQRHKDYRRKVNAR